MNLTSEQQRIVSSTESIIVVSAFAGAGKSSTLRAYAEAHPTWSFLYLCYNKSAQEDAQKKSPKNVTCKTIHSLAYAAVGFKYRHKFGNNRVRDVMNSLNIPKEKITHIKHCLNIISEWCNSAELLLQGYIDKYYKSDLDGAATVGETSATIWNAMQDVTNNDVQMTHDGYLKLYHQSAPLLSYDGVMLDEAQDSNPITVAILECIQCSHKIICGDVHQSIYSFRGARNAIADFAKLTPEVLYLTSTFRFNQVVADYATSILSGLKGETNKIIGAGDKGRVSTYSSAEIQSLPKYTTIIGRRNASLFSVAIECLIKGKKVYFSDGLDRYDLSMILDVANLECWEGTPTHPLIKQFTRFYELETYVEESEEADVSFAVQLVKKYGGRKLKTYITKLREEEVYIKGDFYNRIKEVEYQLTTAHRSKGLEYKVVALLDDFQEIIQMVNNEWHKDYSNGVLQGQDLEDYTQEVNLLYVAATRGKEALYMPYNINSALKSVL